MSSTKWNKERFLQHLRGQRSPEVAAVAEKLIAFTEERADKAAWGRGKQQGSLTFRSRSDFGILSLFQLTSRGQIKFYVNYLKEKNVPRPIIRDYLIKLESNFLRDFDEENYPIDSFQDIGELFSTSTQVEKFVQCIEGIAYRLRQ
ncbi:MAG: hypothetical protein ACE5LH_08220 [Fidelibacterota bacterium]